MKIISLNTVSELIKYKVSLAVCFTAAAGYIISSASIDVNLINLSIGIFILAGGSSALNEYQERNFDAKMKRTRYRPIPSARISPEQALFLAILLILIGLTVLYFSFGFITFLLGLFNVIWYNLFYTNLKKVTAFAVVPGSLTGALPVLIGWAASQANILETKIIFIAFFLFIWQIPHFWLLILKYGNEYAEAGFPTIKQNLDNKKIRKIIFSWVIATSLSSLLIPLFDVSISAFYFLIIFILNLLFVGIFIKLSFGNITDFKLRKSFISINVYMIMFMIVITLYHLLNF